VLANAHRRPHPRPEPLVSVVIATYNWSSVLRYSVASALQQSHRNLEVLVVGDGCTDDSEAVVRSFADSRLRWIPLPENSGSQSAPNNEGIRQARGEFVAYLGHDDLWLPGHLSHSVDVLRRTGGQISSTYCEAIGPPGSNRLILMGPPPLGRSGRWRPPSSLVHRRAAVDVVGPWRDFREIVDPPDTEFLQRFRDAGLMHVEVPALTVVKFPSAWRPDSYRTRASAEQSAYAARIARERLFVERELGRYAVSRLRRRPEHVVQPREPGEGTDRRGWHVSELRRIRGLPPLD
jgi:glycosyltransferase involved in cell wall biosynthesis